MKGFYDINPPENLEAQILKKISRERFKTASFRLVSLGTLSLASLFGLVKSGIFLWQSFSETGFYQYASLIFSDGSILKNYWKEFAFSLVESLPLLALTSVLLISAIFIWSSAKALKDARLILSQT